VNAVAADVTTFSGPLEHFPMPSSGYVWTKRALDVVIALATLMLLAPLLGAIALAVFLDSGRPVLFRQHRVGYRGRPFVILKFRSMRRDADEAVHRRYVESLFAGAPLASVFKIANDARVTRLGAFLRRTSFDELPQLWNVLRGDMSLVGPRPDVPYSVAEYAPWMRGRLAATPGITGLWQVRGRSALSPDEMFRLDLDYVARRSFWFDLEVLMRTVPAVIAGKGAA